MRAAAGPLRGFAKAFAVWLSLGGTAFGILAAPLGLQSTGCGASSFVEVGERTRPAAGRVRGSDVLDLETVAWPAPLLAAHPPDVLAGAAVPLTVLGHQAVRGLYRLTLQPETGEALLLEYRLGENERLPIEVGEALLWRLPLDDRLEPTGLLIQEPSGALRALVVIGETLGPLGDAAVPLGLSPDFSAAALVYSETTAMMSCLVTLDHFALKVSEGGDTVWVRPGTSRLVELSGTKAEATGLSSFELLVFDVSRATGDEDPRCPRRAHVSWALLRSMAP